MALLAADPLLKLGAPRIPSNMRALTIPPLIGSHAASLTKAPSAWPKAFAK